MNILLAAVLAAASTVDAAPSAPPPGAGSAAAVTDDDVVANLAGGLAALRSEVEGLAAAVAARRRTRDDELAALGRRRRDLESRAQQSALLQAELQARAAALRATSAAQAADDERARAPVWAAFDAVLAHVDRVPFRPGARRERLLAGRRAAAALTPQDAAASLWPLILEEARLLDSVGRARQPITLDASGTQTQVVAEVAHVGPLVFWRAKDGRVGHAALGPSGPTRFVVVDDAEGRQRLLLLFEALRRDPAGATFLVPNPLRSTASASSPPAPSAASSSTPAATGVAR
jgi:hypothetical protein